GLVLVAMGPLARLARIFIVVCPLGHRSRVRSAAPARSSFLRGGPRPRPRAAGTAYSACSFRERRRFATKDQATAPTGKTFSGRARGSFRFSALLQPSVLRLCGPNVAVKDPKSLR